MTDVAVLHAEDAWYRWHGAAADMEGYCFHALQAECSLQHAFARRLQTAG